MAFGVFLLLLIVLDVGMIVSLVRQGDERRQDDRLEDQYLYIIGGLWLPVLDIIENLVRSQPWPSIPLFIWLRQRRFTLLC